MDSDLMKVLGAAGGIAIVAIAVIFFSIPAEAVAAEEFYSGSGEGYYWTIEAEVGLAGDRIVSIKVEHEDTPGLADGAIDAVVKEIIAKQSPDVDTISGATGTTRGLIEAVKEALDKAGFSY
ncbi:MAG: FMN-binding protein [Spirochaetaceae bacterium]|nr:MAG: FMN-binding protein [Spirochaetaceae bacterium]